MKKALAQNPNMLRTMIGLGLTLILILGYAVYGATMDSAYHMYRTSNEHVEHTVTDHGLSEDNSTQIWTFSTTRATTWINITLDGVEAGDVLTVSVSTGSWYHHPMLGAEDADRFSCTQPAVDGMEEYNVCSAAQSHVMAVEATGAITMRGIVDEDLPLEGFGSLVADSDAEALEKVEDLIAAGNGTKVWTVTLVSEDEIHPDAIDAAAESARHELVTVEPFTVDPVTEMLWSVAALIGCFGMALVIPLSVFLAAQAKERREDRIREVALADAQPSDEAGL